MLNITYNGGEKPFQKNFGDAGYDLRSSKHYVLKPNQRLLISTENRINIPFGFVGYIMSRSGLAINNGVIVLNAPGVIDYGYTGEIKVILMNFGDEEFTVNQGDRIAQLIVQEIKMVNFIEEEIIKDTKRQENGFGSSGIK